MLCIQVGQQFFAFFLRDSLDCCSFWMKNFPMHFDLDKRLKETCEQMKDLIQVSGDMECVNLVDPSQM